jgi:pimeloyl-ACP methyl ester carboxylesterase
MPEVELTAGTIEYEDTGGDGAPIVFLHGVLNDSSIWRHVVADLRDDYRCVLPTLPTGSHRRPMKADADLTMHAMVRLVAEFLERLDLRDVTLVANDWGGPQVMIHDGLDERVGRLVLTSCEAFDNYPPGLPGRTLLLSARMPGGLNLALQSLRVRPLRRLPMTLGWMSKRVPHEVLDRWLAPAQASREIRRDLRKYGLSPFTKDDLRAWSESLRGFERPALIVWGSEDRVMPPEHGRRLAALLPDSRLVEVPDSYVFIPEDQPAALTKAIREFLTERVTTEA